MMTNEALIRRVHQRAGAIQIRRERQARAALGAMCGLLGFALAALCLGLPMHALPRGDMTGASLLADDVGGYLLAAVLAFMAGVIITVLCLRYQDKNNK